MKYLENLNLERITQKLSGKFLLGGNIINGKVETYSCKKAGEDKKNSKILEEMYSKSTSSSNNTSGSLEISQSLLIDLIHTLNAALLDHDFSSLIKSPTESFKYLPVGNVVSIINSYLAEITATETTFLEELWSSIDESISLSSCEAYQLTIDPFVDIDGDRPYIWSFNFFFFNKELRRICFFSCSASNKYRRNSLFGNIMDDEEDDDLEYNNSSRFNSDHGGQDDSEEDEMDWNNHEW
jgi:hypothetical protein